MKKPELVDKCTLKMNCLTRIKVEQSVDVILELMTNTLADGGRIEFRGFGAFSVKRRSPRIGRNPRSGEACQVEAKHTPFFKPGRLLRKVVNEGG